MVIIPLLLTWIITLYSNGTSTVNLNTTLTGEFITLQLPVQPQSYMMVLVNGSVTAYMINGTSIVIPVLGTANVTITYVPKIFVENNFIGMDVSNTTVEIIIPNNILIANITLSLMGMKMINNELVIMAKGPGEFLYTVMPISTTQSSTSRASAHMHYYEFLTIIMIIAIIVIVAPISYALIMRRGRRTEETSTSITALNLSDYEMSILKYLGSKGGSAFEIDISRDLGIPRTTVWRSVRRLENLGLVRITKVEGKNMVTLVRNK